MTLTIALLAVIAVQSALNGFLVWAVVSAMKDTNTHARETTDVALHDHRERAKPHVEKKIPKPLLEALKKRLDESRSQQAPEAGGEDFEENEFVPAMRGAEFYPESATADSE